MTDAIKEVPTSATDSGFFSGGGPPLRNDFYLVACFGSVVAVVHARLGPGYRSCDL